jgi:hypothetical protein
MGKEENTEFDRTDIGSIDRLISHFEKLHHAEFSESVNCADYSACLEHHRRIGRFGGAVSSLKELKEAILSSETRG